MVEIDTSLMTSYILDDLPYGLYFVDHDRTILFWNKEAEMMTGYSREEVLGKHCYDNILAHIDKNARPLCLTNCPLHATMEDGKFRRAEVFLRHKEGYRIAVKITSTAVYDDNNNRIGAVETFTRNTTKFYSDDLVDSLTNLVMTDKLTGLYNRRHIENYLESKILEVRDRDKAYGVTFLDLDDFSNFNNRYGHDMGDLILKEVSKNVTDNLRETDMFGRWGGEEFVGIFPLRYASEIAIVAEKIRETVEKTTIMLDDGEQSLNTTVSIGATAIEPGDTVESAVTRADELMYRSKKSGKNKVTIG